MSSAHHKGKDVWGEGEGRCPEKVDLEISGSTEAGGKFQAESTGPLLYLCFLLE